MSDVTLRTCPLCDGKGHVLPSDPTAARIGRWTAADRGTQRRASLDNYPRGGSQRRRILDALVLMHRTRSDGMTCEQLADVLRLPTQSCSARLNELWNGGWVKDSGAQRKTRQGSQATVWKPSQLALDPK